MISAALGTFSVEQKPDDIYVAHLSGDALDGPTLADMLEDAAPVKITGFDATDAARRSARSVVAQFGGAGVFEAMNGRILKAHKSAFGEAWPRAYVSAQMLRFCIEPNVNAASMYGGRMEFPYDWCHNAHYEPQTIEELLTMIARYDDRSGASPEDQYLARVLGSSNYTYGNGGEWVHLRSNIIDAPVAFFVPDSMRGYEAMGRIDPPTLEPKLAWKEVNGTRIPISNAKAGLETRSEPTKLTYQDGTTGLIMAALKLGVNKQWPKRYGFSAEHLPSADIRNGSIFMEAPQVPLLAQVSASTILNHEAFTDLLS